MTSPKALTRAFRSSAGIACTCLQIMSAISEIICSGDRFEGPAFDFLFMPEV